MTEADKDERKCKEDYEAAKSKEKEVLQPPESGPSNIGQHVSSASANAGRSRKRQQSSQSTDVHHSPAMQTPARRVSQRTATPKTTLEQK